MKATRPAGGPRRVPRELYPFESHFLDRGGLRYHYLDEGRGDPVIMLHGNPTWSFYYRNLVLALRDRYRTIVPDHIGMGLSDKPDDRRYDYRLASRVDDLTALIDDRDLGDNLTLVMHDWGGMIGMAYAARFPERIARLVLLNTAAFRLPVHMRVPLALRVVRDTAVGAAAVRGLNAFSRIAAHIGCRRRPMDRELRGAYCAPYDSWANRIATLRFVEDIPLAPGDPSYALVREVESSLDRFRDTPALFCWGDRDFVFTPAVLDEWRARWPHAEIERFPDCGHYVLEDAPDETCARVRAFLARTAAAPARAPRIASAAPVENVAARLSEVAARTPDAIAIHEPVRRRADGTTEYRRTTYRELDAESDVIARGLTAVGIGRGVRAVLMVPPGPDFFALCFGMAKAGVVPVMIDPGMSTSSLGRCIDEAEPEAFIGVPKAHAARLALGWGGKHLRGHVTVGGPAVFGGLTLEAVRRAGAAHPGPALVDTRADEVAAILFTSGSTGTPKGVVYTHATFAAQVRLLLAAAGLGTGEVDLPTFPLFALFDPAFGMTTVVPEMDFAHPAKVDPARLADAIMQQQVTNMFASVAVLDALSRWGTARGLTLPSLRRVVCAGAYVPGKVLARFAALLSPGASILTPYGATEALPVTLIASAEILGETRARTAAGAGVCVGRPLSEMEVAIIPVSDEPIGAWRDELRLAAGAIGEIAVKGPVVTRRYWKRDRATALAKIPDGQELWHRMGDVGYLDVGGRLWFCGRKGQRVALPDGTTLFTVACEGVFDVHPDVYRTALVGVRRGGAAVPVLCVELEPARSHVPRARLIDELRALGARYPHTRRIDAFLIHPGFPVDSRHNAKIRHEELAAWAEQRLR